MFLLRRWVVILLTDTACPSHQAVLARAQLDRSVVIILLLIMVCPLTCWELLKRSCLPKSPAGVGYAKNTFVGVFVVYLFIYFFLRTV